MSKVFEPFRVLGLVSNGVPSVLQTRGNEHFVTTCVGRAFNTYNCKKLNLVFASPLHEGDISCMAGHKDLIFTTVHDTIHVWSRAKLVSSFMGHTGTIVHLLPFGEHLISIAADKRLLIHEIESGEVYAELSLDHSITSLLHPATYLNKVLLGTENGVMELWNVRTMRLIYQFAGFTSKITALAQSPAIDVVAVGCQSGKVVIHNLRTDETLMSFHQDWGCVTSLSFRADGVAHLVSGSTEGHLAVWDLEKQQLHSTVHSAHAANLSTALYLSSQALLLTSGTDNAVKLWVFDGPGGTARMLRERTGHSAPPTVTRFYGASCETILTAGHDRSLRSFCVFKDERSRELSQGSILSKSKKLNVGAEELKLSPVTALAAEEIREREWCNVMTAHVGDKNVRLWSTCNAALSSKPLLPKLDTVVVSAVCLTACGNVGVVGYNSGHLTAFNVQSGNNRGLYGKGPAHKGRVTGVATDSINKVVISVGRDSTLKIWDFSARSLLSTVSLPSPALRLSLHRESNLAAVALASGTVVLVDIDTTKIVREFRHPAPATDMCYSQDCKWLVVASADKSVRVWDLVTARLVDCFKTDSLVTSLSLSPEHLVTTHQGDLGICLWINKTLYESVELKPLPDDAEPRLVGALDTPMDLDEPVTGDEELEWKGTEQIQADLVTLSDTPRAKWTALCNLDVIKRRNKPKAPPTAPKAAPFFLQTTKELVPKFVIEEKEPEEKETSKPLRVGESDFQRMLLTNAGNTQEILRYLDSMPTPMLDLELQSLSPVDGGSHELVEGFLNFLTAAHTLRTSFDLVQAYTNVFLKYNRQYLMETAPLREELTELKNLHKDQWAELQRRIQEVVCVTNFLKNVAL